MASATTVDIGGFWSRAEGDLARTVFAAQGIRCAACSKTIERAVGAIPGIKRVKVNVATSRVSVDFDPGQAALPAILAAVEQAGFKPEPLSGNRSEANFQHERRTALKRIGLAGIGMMQVMMYVLGVYVAPADSMDPAIASYLRYVGLIITTPVLFYSGAPYLQGALRDLRRRTLGMDVPVALALSLAYAASLFNTVRGTGQTYFDSVTMFIFFLGAGRYLEMMVRQRGLSLSDAVGRSLPASASRVTPDGSRERVALEKVSTGDCLFIPKGGVIPVDVCLAEGNALIDESLVTGESKPERKDTGSWIPGGALNLGDPIRVIAQSGSASSTLASIVALLERAQNVRPKISRIADRIANRFIASILLFAMGVAVAWVFVDPSRAFPAALAVLVVTCPCALSLATPLAVAAASLRLARIGLLVTRADALERLADVTTVVIDKTGTLTSGQTAIGKVTLLSNLREQDVLGIAAALERDSTHPIAAAFSSHFMSSMVATEVEEVTGSGMSGVVNGKIWRLGRRDYVMPASTRDASSSGDDNVCLGNDLGFAAMFEMHEELRPHALETVQNLRAVGIEVVLASGDRPDAVDTVAKALGIANARSRQSPEQKLEIVQGLQAQGRRVLMLGDGVNDGPVLAAADVSCAMSEGSAIAHAAADLLLVSDSMDVVSQGIATARRMKSIIRGNLLWALAYNVVAVPLAALDLVPPWLAAIGMSASSLIVVLNARRLSREDDR